MLFIVLIGLMVLEKPNEINIALLALFILNIFLRRIYIYIDRESCGVCSVKKSERKCCKIIVLIVLECWFCYSLIKSNIYRVLFQHY